MDLKDCIAIRLGAISVSRDGTKSLDIKKILKTEEGRKRLEKIQGKRHEKASSN